MIQSLIEYVYYSSTLLSFYGYLIPTIGTDLREKCYDHIWCSYYLKKTSLGYRVDMADGQWREFRDSLPLLMGVAMLGVVLHNLWRYWQKNVKGYSHLKSTQYQLLFGLVVIVVQHGWHSGVVLGISCGGYVLAKTFRGLSRNQFLVLVYVYGLSIICLKESYRLQHRPQFEFLRILFDRSYGGLYSWHVPANFLVLRVVSFMLDFHWASIAEQEKKNDSDRGSGCDDDIVLNGKSCPHQSVASSNASQHCPIQEYNVVNFLSYCVYAPLYIAGPIITFNSYIHYSNNPQKSESVITYGIRWIFAFVLMEVGLTYFPFFAIINSGIYKDFSAPQLAILAYCTLKLMWMKFLLLWRFFRLWALADGMLPPENQVRCMSNNQSIGQFWKGWHASFNLWLVRYMYVPLGGRDKAWLSVWPIFLFVAIWHDIEPKLLLWGALNSGFYVVEMIASRVGKSAIMEHIPVTVRRFLDNVGAATLIMVLIGVNMTGYAVGAGGVQFIASRILTMEGVTTIFWSFYFLTSGVCIMNFLKEKGLSK